MSSRADTNPFGKFAVWQEEANESGLRLATAVALATADRRGRPSVRMVLCRGADERGFIFYTNLESRKGAELAENPYGALCFYWMPLGKQVCVEGRVEPVQDTEADAYFATRERGSQIGAWASPQSRPMKRRFELKQRVLMFALKFGLGKIPRPPFWSGFRIVPERIEFWEEGPSRLHYRLLYKRVEDGWTSEILYP